MKISARLPFREAMLAVGLFAVLASAVASGAIPPVGAIRHRQITVPQFGELPADTVLAADEFFVVASDKFPVSQGHTLIIARRSVARFQELSDEEKIDLIRWVDWTQQTLLALLAKKPDGFNFGLNDGAAAGQTKPQFHFHIIPRYIGDVVDPRGGVRSVIPAKSNYWEKAQGNGS